VSGNDASTGAGHYSRRNIIKVGAVAAAAGTLAIGVGTATASRASALGPILGTVIDYSAGVPSATAIKAAGHLALCVMFRKSALMRNGWPVSR
jgi:hypothetical protein